MYFIFDIDGTICFGDNKISEKIFNSLEKAEKYGHKIAFASARAYRDCIPVITEKYRNNLIFSLNGAVVFENGKILKHNIISSKAYKKLSNFV